MEFTEFIIAAIAIISIFALPIIAGIILGLRFMKNRHAERMGLIEQGVIPPQKEKRRRTPSRLVSLRNGIMLVSLGVGLFAGFILVKYVNFSFIQLGYLNIIVVGTAIVFLGLGYLIYFWVSKDMPDNGSSDDSENNDLA